MEQRVSIITLGVSDLVRSTSFYEKKFGWTKSSFSNEYISFFELNGIQLSLYVREELAKDATVSHEGSGFRGITIAYNTRSKEEVDELIAQFKKQGVEVVKEPKKTDWGGYSSYIADPDRYLWEIAYNPFIDLGPLK